MKDWSGADLLFLNANYSKMKAITIAERLGRTLKEVNAMGAELGLKKVGKYKNRKIAVDGVTYDSLGEYDRYCYLRLLQQAGEISDLKRQIAIVLQDKFTHGGQTINAVKYIADFTYMESDICIIEDFKGYRTKDYILKKKRLLNLIHTGQIQAEFREVGLPKKGKF